PAGGTPPKAEIAQPGAAVIGDTATSSSAFSIAPSTATIPVVTSGPVTRPDARSTGGEIVAYLMTFCIQQREAEAKLSSKTLKSLHMKLKNSPNDMETLMRSVDTKGEVPGECITVPRTLDGRQQV
ncbi:hypothetical protein PENTCL1PPCAC_26173, partial [Pristionchus entomophagus]